MKILASLDDFPAALRGGARLPLATSTAYTLGHARLVERLRAMARRVSGPAVVFCFDPPPARLLRPSDAPEPLIWLERKLEILAALGVDATLVLSHHKEFSPARSPVISSIAWSDRGWQPGQWSRGRTFSSGHGRAGDVELLRRFCAETDMPFEVAEPVEVAGKIVSSSRIRGPGRRRTSGGGRQNARASVSESAARSVRGAMDAGPHSVFPRPMWARSTPCCRPKGFTPPRARVRDGWLPAAVSLGPNPTFDEGSLKVEAYVIGFSGDLYDRPIEIDLLTHLRKIERFASRRDLGFADGPRRGQNGRKLLAQLNPPMPMIAWSRFVEIVRGH